MNLFGIFKRKSARADRADDERTLALLHINQRTAEAFQLSEAGNHRQSNQTVEEILADLAGATGSVVDDVRGKLLGLGGLNSFRLGDVVRSRDFMLAAVEECRRVGDSAGVRVYRDNLRQLDRQPASRDPKLFDLEIALLKRLDRCQRLTDQTRYAESNLRLSEILESDDFRAAGLAARYEGKVHGLMGTNYFFQGDLETARDYAMKGLEDCRRLRDAGGVRIYTHNLNQITKSSLSSD